MAISAIILTKNEEKNITECLNTLSWCDERIVIDDESTDNTAGIARHQGAKVFVHPLHENFSAQRNFGLEKAKNQWVLFVDADERITKELQEEISDAIIAENFDGFFIPRKDNMWGRWIKHGDLPLQAKKQGMITLVRLGKKHAGSWTGHVHEVWNITRTGLLTHPILHYPHPTASEFLTEINHYSTIRANELFQQQKKAHWWNIVVYPLGKFLKNYIWNAGYKDGMQGMIIAAFMSFHSFLVRAKLWLLYNNRSSTVYEENH